MRTAIKRMTFTATIVCVAIAVAGPQLHVYASRPHRAARDFLPGTSVITYVNGQVVQYSPHFQRLFIIGGDENIRPTPANSTVFAVVATDTPQLVSRSAVNGTIDNEAIDEQRGIAYMSVQSTPNLSSPTSHHEDLWAVDLTSGQILSHQLYYEGEAETINAMSVDATTGHVFVAVSRPGSQTYELTMIDPVTHSMHIQTLLGTPQNLWINTAAKRVAVSTVVALGPNPSSLFDGYDTRDESSQWTHQFSYLTAAYTSFANFFDTNTQQAWVLAPGGLVTRVDVATGNTIEPSIQMGFVHPDVWNLNGFAVNTTTEEAYASWNDPWTDNHGNTECHVDKVDPNTGLHTPWIDYGAYLPTNLTTPCGVPSATLLTVDTAKNNVIAADGSHINVFSVATGLVAQSYSLLKPDGTPSSWNTWINVQRPDHLSVVFIADVHYQNQGTGANTAGSATFIDV